MGYHGRSVCYEHEGKTVRLRLPRIRQRLLQHLFRVKGSETSSKKSHILMRIRHLFFAESNETRFKKRAPHLDKCCFLVDEWPLNAVLHKKKILNPRSFRRKYCSNIRFHCRQKLLVILHYSKSFKWIRSNQNTRRMYKII